ncbi:MAG: molybdate ABC transporter permease subunit [Lachnospiraceae bacterium]|nr:molybdate ABC transporter permease subunit [Candidatus Colinaster scatohippi]
MEAFLFFIKGLDLSPLIISLKTGIVATIICFFLGLYLAAKVVKKDSGMRAFLDGLLTLPMVIPPTAVGFFLLLIFSRRRPVGKLLFNVFDISVVQTWAGCVIAAMIIAFPLMYRNARAAFEQVDSELIYAARTLGISEKKIFWKIIVPNAAPGIRSGTILTFARAIGEYGATSMLAGNIAGKTGTISQKIAMVIQDGDYMAAGFWSIVVLLIAFVIIVGVNMTGTKAKRKW